MPKTFDELATAAKKIKAKTGATALYLRGDDPYWFLPYLYGEGGDMVDARDKVVEIDDGAGVKAFKTIKDLVDSKAAVTDATDGQENQLRALKDGTVAMAVDGPWDIEGARAGKAFKDKKNLGVAPVPGGSTAQGSPQGGWNLSVYAGSKNLQASYAFVKYMSSAEVQQQTTEELSLLPDPQVRLRGAGRQEQRDGQVLQARRRRAVAAPLDRRGQLPLRADQGPDEQGAHRRRHARAGRQGDRRRLPQAAQGH